MSNVTLPSKRLSSERIADLIEHFQGALTDMVLTEPTDSEHAMALAESVCYVTDAITSMKELQQVRDSAPEPRAMLTPQEQHAIYIVLNFCKLNPSMASTIDVTARTLLKGLLDRAAQPPAVDETGSVGDPEGAASQLLQSYFWLKTLKPNTRYVRLQDDHDGEFRGHLSVTIGEDGDAWVSLDEASARFRMPGFGGGASQYTRTALVILAEAIRRDNAEHPRRSAPTKGDSHE